MHILLTNDDGIYAEGIYALYLELKKLGSITIVAPDTQKSSVGHGITLAHPLWHSRVKRKGRFFGTGISGTPADCVKFATSVLLKKKPDVVVSGINLGPNEGCSVFYSGTVAGAREGALLGIPALAISLNTFGDADFSYAAKCGAKLVQSFGNKNIPKGTFLNVNVPHVKPSQIKGIRMVRQGLKPIHGTFRKRRDPNLREYYWMAGKLPGKKKNDQSDTYYLNDNYVTVTPIHSDSTDYTFLEKMRGFSLK